MKRNRMWALRLSQTVILIGFFIFAAFPLYWMLITSLKDRKEIYSSDLTLWPAQLTFSNYIDTFRNAEFPQFFINSVGVTILSSFFVLIVSVMGGYSLARYHFKGKSVALLAFLITQMVPTMVMLIPLFILFGKLGLVNKLVSLLILYSVINIPFCLITISGFFQRIPISLEEAAMIDGCSRIGAVMRIVLPVMLPGIVATFVFAFTGAWNELFFGIMFINGGSSATIPVGLNSYVQKFDINWGQMSAGGVISLIPVAVLFMFIQKYIVAGLTQGAVKG